MKSHLSSLIAPVLLALALPAVAQVREETTKTTTTTTNGTLNEIGPERIVVRTESNTSPLTYSVRKTTTYVDDTGAPVSMETVKSGLPITVHYTRDGDALVASKIIVHKHTTTTPEGTATETTTTTTKGTITEFAPSERVVIRSTASSNPLRYRFTKSTVYVDRAGNPVSVKTIKTGLPATIHYVKEGDDLVATRVVVGTLDEAPAGEVRRTETTTTTTTGTVSEFNSDRVVVRTEASADPLTYTFSKTTTYVDEEGNPVTAESVRSGAPVTVHYTTEGDRRIATRIIVRKIRK